MFLHHQNHYYFDFDKIHQLFGRILNLLFSFLLFSSILFSTLSPSLLYFFLRSPLFFEIQTTTTPSFFFMYYITYFSLLENPKNKISLFVLIMLSKYIINQNEDHLLDKFTDKCYGNEISMLDIKKEMWNSKKKITFYRP